MRTIGWIVVTFFFQNQLLAGIGPCKLQQQFNCKSEYVYKADTESEAQRVPGPSKSAKIENLQLEAFEPEECVGQIELETFVGKFHAQYIQANKKTIAWLELNGKEVPLNDFSFGVGNHKSSFETSDHGALKTVFFNCRTDD